MKSLLVLLAGGILSLAATSCQAQPPLLRLKETLVAISTPEGKVFCSGVAVGKHRVWTKSHCLIEKYPPGVMKFNGKGCKGDRIVREEPKTDNVIVETCATFNHTANFALRAPVLGEQVWEMGYPLGEGPYLRTGVYSGLDKDGALMFDMMTAGGDSGGPIFNSDGQVICTVGFGNGRSVKWPNYDLTGCYQFSRKK